jgi:hypothetical protein
MRPSLNEIKLKCKYLEEIDEMIYSRDKVDKEGDRISES